MEIDLSGPLATAYEKAKSQYHIAIQNNDTDLAQSKASECAVICRQLARALPRKKEHFSLLSEQWQKKREEISENKKTQVSETTHDNSRERVEKSITIQKPDITFDAIAGLDSVKELIKECIVYPFKYPEEYEYFGVSPGGGILFYGPPGCGKTLIAAAASGESDAFFLSVKVSDIRDKYVGESEKNIRAVFELAQKYDRSIIFFDEIDALGSQRSSSQDLHEKTLINELLSQMDGIERKMKHRQCLILAATNRPWDIDLALRRPGRFDTAIFIPHPDFDARKKLFEISFRNKPAKVDIELLAGMTHGFTSAEIVNICQNAAKIPLRERIHELKRRRQISNEDCIQIIQETRPLLAIWYENAIKEIQKTSQEDAFQDLIQEARKFSRESYDVSLNTNTHLVFDDSLFVETDIQREVIEAILHIAEELKNEGREGHSIGTSFIVGDSENVMGKSRQLIINPFQGHDPCECRIQNPDFQETIKEFAQLDGAFVVRGDGVLVAAGRYITVDSSIVQVTRGYGTRHSSVAAITQYTRALGIVVSQSGGKIKIFKNGKSIIPHS